MSADRSACQWWCGRNYQNGGCPVLMMAPKDAQPPYPSYFAWLAGYAPAEVWCTPLCCAERRPAIGTPDEQCYDPRCRCPRSNRVHAHMEGGLDMSTHRFVEAGAQCRVSARTHWCGHTLDDAMKISGGHIKGPKSRRFKPGIFRVFCCNTCRDLWTFEEIEPEQCASANCIEDNGPHVAHPNGPHPPLRERDERGRLVIVEDPEPIHGWFELSYAQYLTVPRSVLQSMSAEWQRRFVTCLKQLDETIDWRPDGAQYWVTLRGHHGAGNELLDPLADYERGRRRVPHRSKE